VRKRRSDQYSGRMNPLGGPMIQERSPFAAERKTPRPSVTLIGFGGDGAARVEEGLDQLGCETRCAGSLNELPSGGIVFVSGDNANFTAIISAIRKADPSIFVAVITQAPAAAKWLDGLEAGANDYYHLPLDGWTLRFLFRQAFEFPAPPERFETTVNM